MPKQPERHSKQLYDARFYAGQEWGSSESAKQVVPLLLELVGMKSVCDVGCGVGTWLAAFMDEGVSDVLGMDGDYIETELLRIPKSKFRPTDLNQSFSIGRSFDAAISLEVAEHLDQRRAASFVSDLAALSSVVIFSAAIPGQGGTGHINEQWPDYWVKLFRERGYVCIDAIRQKIWENEAIEFWYRQNMFVFCEGHVLHQFPKLVEAQRSMLPLRIVHPMQHIRRGQLGLKDILRSFPRALYCAVARRIKPR